MAALAAAAAVGESEPGWAVTVGDDVATVAAVAVDELLLGFAIRGAVKGAGVAVLVATALELGASTAAAAVPVEAGAGAAATGRSKLA